MDSTGQRQVVGEKEESEISLILKPGRQEQNDGMTVRNNGLI